MMEMHTAPTRDKRRLGPYSRPAALVTMDMRTKEARLLRDTRAELTAHVGGTNAASATQRALIEQCAQLRLRLATMDRAFAEAGGKMTAHDSRTYLAWANSYSRLLRQLGLRGAPAPVPSLAEYLASKAAAAPASAAPAALAGSPAPAQPAAIEAAQAPATAGAEADRWPA